MLRSIVVAIAALVAAADAQAAEVSTESRIMVLDVNSPKTQQVDANAIGGMVIGQQIRARLSDATFRRVFFVSVFIVGLYIIGSTLLRG